MKQIYTRARKANRSSAWRRRGAHDTPFGSKFERRVMTRSLRRAKRMDLQPKKFKTYGCQVVRTQRIFLKKDRFGAPIYRTIKHGVQRQQ